MATTTTRYRQGTDDDPYSDARLSPAHRGPCRIGRDQDSYGSWWYVLIKENELGLFGEPCIRWIRVDTGTHRMELREALAMADAMADAL